MGLFDLFSERGRKDRFAKQLMDRLQQLGWPHPMSYDPSNEVITLGGKAGRMSLQPTYGQWRRHPRHARAAALDDAIAFVFEMDPDPVFEDVVGMLIPVVRPRRILEAMEHEPLDEPRADTKGAWRPLGDHLAIHVAIDRPHSRTLVSAFTLGAWGQSFDTVFAIAMDNLREAAPLRFESQEGGFLTSDADDGNDIARLLLPEQFAALKMAGAPVVVAAARDLLLVAGSEDLVGLDSMAEVIPGLLHDHPLPISYAPMILIDGRWQAFAPPAELYAARALQAHQRDHDYSQQRPLLQDRLAREGRPDEVAALLLFPAPEGVLSLSLWMEPSCLLPEADQIVIRTGAGETLVREWSDVERACGGFAREPNTSLPYGIATNWPSREAMEAIKAAPEPPWAKDKGIGVVNDRLTLFG